MIIGQVVIVEYDGTRFQLINGNNLRVAGTTSGIATIVTPAVAGTPTITLPIVTGTLATLAGTETFTNKTLTSPVLDTAVTGTAVATQAQQETATATNVLVTPGRQQYHPGHPKGWVVFGVTGNILSSYNVASITDVGTGRATVVWDVDFSSANYSAICTLSAGTALSAEIVPTVRAAGSLDFYSLNTGNTLTDPTDWSVIACGDQA
jgi:hypothetical protein